MNRKNATIVILILAIALSFASCGSDKQKQNFIKENIEFATAQTDGMLVKTGEPNGKNYPRTMADDGSLVVTDMYDWTPGFFPGSLWYLYELTGDEKWKTTAEKWTASLEPLKTFTGHHDLGFMMYCSYGNAERLASKPEYKDIIVESANSLSTRFSPKTQAIKSWNQFKSWSDSSISYFPVIIDNMMNLEMLFYASRATGDKKYYDIAVAHAKSTMKNQMRDDYSVYHVVSYDSISGQVINKYTAQGYSDNSTWSRGQAWAVYGFTMVYRETKDPQFLDVAVKAADFYLKNLPDDLVPLWDFNAGQDGYIPGNRSYALQFQGKELRDASAAAITCSALFELGELSGNKSYIDSAVKMLHSLASPAYRAQLNANANFLLMHSVGSIPHKTEIDRPLVYADYYFLEALNRYKNLKDETK